jgi:phosphoribosylformimino-5-aminoimidazole carboxamide ribotide isomerase
MTVFRPCIDLHDGVVKQIVGSTLKDDYTPLTNFISNHSPTWYASLYKGDNLKGGHVIMLGKNNEKAALFALKQWPKGLQIGGGITLDSALKWLNAGAEKVILTSWLFTENEIDLEKAAQLKQKIGAKNLVIDLSCKKTSSGWFVATNRWQNVTRTQITAQNLDILAEYCSEFLIHATDVEGKCQGIDLELVEFLGKHCPIPCTYAGGAKSITDLEDVKRISNSRVDLTFGSALDIFGGTLVKYQDCVLWNKQQKN